MLGDKLKEASAGAAGGDQLYVDDVFSTYLWEGDGGYNLSPPAATVTVDNGIDLSGEGGLVWLKNRGVNYSHWLFDTEREGHYYLHTNDPWAQVDGTSSKRTVTFNNTGFVVGKDDSSGGLNNRTYSDNVSWTFRKAPGFFDVVKYTGTGSTVQSIPHNLGCVPGFIIVKNLDDTGGKSWMCYHSGMGNDHHLKLDDDGLKVQNENFWDQTNPTSTHFTVGTDSDVNKLNHEHIAYIFADGSDADSAVFGADGDKKIIKCGSYTGTGGTEEIDCGFEPQWVLIKKTGPSFDDSWVIFDMMREWNTSTDSHSLRPDLPNNENTGAGRIHPTPTGFKVVSNDGTQGGDGYDYIYVAIRRPHKPPEAGTDVYEAGYAETGNNNNVKNTTNFPVDLVWYNTNPVGGNSFQWFDRMRGSDRRLISNSNTGNSNATCALDYSDGLVNEFSTSTGYLYEAFKRAPGVFDIVHYSGNISATNQQSHNLGVTPQLIIVKNLDGADPWQVFTNFGSSTYDRLQFTSDAATESISYGSSVRIAAQPTTTNFTLGQINQVNQSNENFIAYLFASLEGISKVDFYNASSGDVDVNCGFSPRFVLIKAHNVSGSWWVFDTTRGINPGTDARLELNGNPAQDSTVDSIDLLSDGTGFRVAGGDSYINSTTGGAKFLYLAIA